MLRALMGGGDDRSARAARAGVWPLEAASMRGVDPKLFDACASAPEDRRGWMHSRWPADAAACRGVLPLPSFWLMSGGGVEERREVRDWASQGRQRAWRGRGGDGGVADSEGDEWRNRMVRRRVRGGGEGQGDSMTKSFRGRRWGVQKLLGTGTTPQWKAFCEWLMGRVAHSPPHMPLPSRAKPGLQLQLLSS